MFFWPEPASLVLEAAKGNALVKKLVGTRFIAIHSWQGYIAESVANISIPIDGDKDRITVHAQLLKDSHTKQWVIEFMQYSTEKDPRRRILYLPDSPAAKAEKPTSLFGKN